MKTAKSSIKSIEKWSKAQKSLVTAMVLALCSLNVAGQEPVDSITVVNDTQFDLYLSPDSTELLIIDVEQLIVYPVDTASIYFTHSPAKAAIMSAVVPGLGQFYNKKYWKVPIVYAAIGVSAGMFIKWQNEYNRYRRAYIDIFDKDPYTNFFDTLGFPPSYSLEQKSQYITKRKEQLRTWRDYTILAVVLTYALNIIDANVDAHLMDFNLEDNISLNIRPSFFENDMNIKKIGLTLRLSF